jgi:hypothetical protein
VGKNGISSVIFSPVTTVERSARVKLRAVPKTQSLRKRSMSDTVSGGISCIG